MHKCLSILTTAVLALSGCASFSFSTRSTTGDNLAARSTKSNWQNESIYFVLLDRFSNGDRSNDYNVNPSNPTAYHGGDIQGLIDKLDYIKDLGFSTVWISPVVDNDDDQLAKTGLWGYHGYWAKDFSKVDEHLGTMAKLKELVQKAHEKGMKVLIDIVCNHAGYSFVVAHPDLKGYFHQNGDIQNWDDPKEVENKAIFGLPDFAQEKPEVKSYLVDTFSWWLKQTGADGYRVDTVKHVPLSFWSTFTHEMKGQGAYLLGEALIGDPGTMSKYQRDGGFDSLFDFPLYYTIRDVFAYDQSMRKLPQRLAQDSSYQDARMLSTIVDNHDLPRFMHLAKQEAKLKLALAFIATIRGIPCLYQGTEVAMTGGDDPENRKDMAWNSNAGMLAYTKKLFNLRKGSDALKHGTHYEMWQDDQIFAYLRKADSAEVVTVLNNSSKEEVREIPLRAESTLKDGTVLLDKLGSGTVTVQNRKIQVHLAAKSARIFFPQ